jgi:hypothetical protein
MSEIGQHFRGCHPEDAQAPEAPKGYQPQETEDCWHCGTPTTRGCHCQDCLEGSDYVPMDASYHCKTCGRWWAWMTGLNITEITFGKDEGR